MAQETGFMPMSPNDASPQVTRQPEPAAVSGARGNKLAIVIPAYNEAEGVALVLRQLIDVLSAAPLPDWKIIVVDDGSEDGTAEALRQFDDNVVVLRHQQNRGYGAALKTGILATDAELICITDADGTYPADKIPELVAEQSEHGYDMVVGARSGKNVHVPTIHKPAKWVIGRLVNYVTTTKVPDFNSGLRVFRREVAMRMLGLFPEGFSFTTTITLAMLTNHYRVHYIAVDYHARLGRSKIRPIRDTLGFLRLLVAIGLYFAPLKVFMP